MTTDRQALFAKIADIISEAENIVSLTGAGISVESGIPPFRGKGGVWERFDPIEFAHIDRFMENPEKVWNLFLREFRETLCKARPNDAHRALAQLEEMGLLKAIITQNIDCLHQEAGSRKVIEFHGNFATLSCTQCGATYSMLDINIDPCPPRCECGGILRPDCVFYGESIPPEALEKAFKLAETCDVMLVIGTSAEVQPAAFLPRSAKEAGATVIEINLEPTPLSTYCDLSVSGQAASVLNRLLSLMSG